MKNIIVITELRAFGALAARALAIAGHTVYASMRETTDRNAAQVEAARQFATENGVDLRTIELDVASQESATRPSKRSSRKTAVSTLSSITRDTWYLARRRHSLRNNFWRSMTRTCLARSGSTVPRCRDCANRRRAWSSGLEVPALAEACRLIFHPTLRPRQLGRCASSATDGPAMRYSFSESCRER
jgi:molybdenum cofactor biosynthesis enzyme MoaA